MRVMSSMNHAPATLVGSGKSAASSAVTCASMARPEMQTARSASVPRSGSSRSSSNEARQSPVRPSPKTP